jgi:hypothetical protein
MASSWSTGFFKRVHFVGDAPDMLDFMVEVNPLKRFDADPRNLGNVCKWKLVNHDRVTKRCVADVVPAEWTDDASVFLCPGPRLTVVV